jgi:DNA-binding NtrC family response regulator
MPKTKKIVVVDDEEGIKNLLGDILLDVGYEVFSYEDPREALSFISDNHIDMLLSDIRMPYVDGFTLAATAKDVHSNVTVILISGGGIYTYKGKDFQLSDVLSTFEFVDDVLKKPFAPTRLIELVDFHFSK